MRFPAQSIRAWQALCCVDMMPTVRNAGILCVILATGCAGVREAPPIVLARSVPLAVEPSLIGSGHYQVVTTDASAAAVKAEVPAAVAEVPAAVDRSASRESGAITARPLVKPFAKAPSAMDAVVRTDPGRIPAPTAQAEPPLDVAALKMRLKDTRAIGVLTKLVLKNQVDDLLKQFRAHYQGGTKGSVAPLRETYDLLVLKVLALVQDGDPPLARTISGSREAIWRILADPDKFKLIS